MLEISEYRHSFKESPILVYGRNYDLETGNLLISSDVASIRYTIFEKDSPESEDETPVPYFTDINVDVNVSVVDGLKTRTLNTRYGPKTIEYNTRVVIAPIKQTSGGEVSWILPFPTLGKFYRVVITFEMADSTIPRFPQVEVIQSV